MAVGQDLLNVPFPEMVEKLAMSIAHAQTALDTNSTRVAKFMGDEKVKLPPIEEGGQELEMSMLALGFFPGFYQFTESEIEVKMAISMTKTQEFGLDAEVKAGWGPYSASVNASYSSKYSYSVEGSSRLYVKLTPTPPPQLLEKYIEAVIDNRSKTLEDDTSGNGSDSNGG